MSLDQVAFLVLGVVCLALGVSMSLALRSVIAFAEHALERALAINDNELALSKTKLEMDQSEVLLREAREKARIQGLSYAPSRAKDPNDPDVTASLPGINA